MGSGLLALALVCAVFTYQQAGLTSATQFADYLFGVTYFGGDIRYLYDTLLATDVATFIAGIVGLARTRDVRLLARSPETGTPTSE